MKNATNMSYDVGYKDGANDGYRLAKSDMQPLLDAAINTLNNNLHLCDGTNCTLYELKIAVEKFEPNWEKL